MLATSFVAHKAITCTCTTIKTSCPSCSSGSWLLAPCLLAGLLLDSGFWSLEHVFLSVCPLVPPCPLGTPFSGCHAIAISLAFTTLQHFLLRLLSFVGSQKFFPFAFWVQLLAIFHMQHATDVFMFSVCAAHKKVNEQHPRNWRQVSITAMASTVGQPWPGDVGPKGMTMNSVQFGARRR